MAQLLNVPLRKGAESYFTDWPWIEKKYFIFTIGYKFIIRLVAVLPIREREESYSVHNQTSS